MLLSWDVAIVTYPVAGSPGKTAQAPTRGDHIKRFCLALMLGRRGKVIRGKEGELVATPGIRGFLMPQRKLVQTAQVGGRVQLCTKAESISLGYGYPSQYSMPMACASMLFHQG